MNKTSRSLKEKVLEHKQVREELQKAIAEIKTLRGVIPICSYCKKIRNDAGAWDVMESYLNEHTDAEFSHGVCPDCLEMQMAELDKAE